jgi:fructose-1,6-bisphosphatase/inositol monophosphatase family enzyme
MTIDIDDVSVKALDAVINVGNFVKESQHKIVSIKYKGIKNPQTDVDIAAEDKLKKILSEIIPNSGFELEEGVSLRDKDYIWVIDPIDGTKFFSTQYPVFYTQIALLYKGVNVFSAIYNPVSSQLFHAIKDRGAYYNNKRVTLQYDGPLSNTLLSIEFGQFDDSGVSISLLDKLAPKVSKVYSTGLFIPYLLTNTVQAYMRYYNGENFIYDMEPRLLLIREAEGVVHEHMYNGRKLFIAAHPKLVREIEQVLAIS